MTRRKGVPVGLEEAELHATLASRTDTRLATRTARRLAARALPEERLGMVALGLVEIDRSNRGWMWR